MENYFHKIFGALTGKPARGSYREILLPNYFRGLVRAPLALPQKRGPLPKKKGALNEIYFSGILLGALAGISGKSLGHLPQRELSGTRLLVYAGNRRQVFGSFVLFLAVSRLLMEIPESGERSFFAVFGSFLLFSAVILLFSFARHKARTITLSFFSLVFSKIPRKT